MDRTRACWMSVFAVALSVAIMAAQPGGCQPAKLPAAGDLAGQTGPVSPCPLMQALDTNADAELSQEEILAAPNSILALDANGDGVVSADELCPVVDPPASQPADGTGLPPCPPCPCLLMKALDGNGDGALSADEIAAAADALLTLDQNNDWILTSDEICPPVSPPPQPPTRPELCPLMLALDVDQSGDLSAEEIANAPEALRVLDVNGDGALTVDELCPESGCPGNTSNGNCDNPGKGLKDKGNAGKGYAYGHDKEKHGKGNAYGHSKDKGSKCGEDGDEGKQDGQASCWCLRFCCLMQVLNTDGDCQLSAEEIANATEALLTLDQNGDGVLSAAELCPPVADKLGDDSDDSDEGCYGGDC